MIKKWKNIKIEETEKMAGIACITWIYWFVKKFKKVQLSDER